MWADYLSIATQLQDSKAVPIWKAEPEAQRNEHSSSITKEDKENTPSGVSHVSWAQWLNISNLQFPHF